MLSEVILKNADNPKFSHIFAVKDEMQLLLWPSFLLGAILSGRRALILVTPQQFYTLYSSPQQDTVKILKQTLVSPFGKYAAN